MSMKIHLLIPDDIGPVHSGGLLVNTPLGPFTAAKPGRWRAACGPEILLGEMHRGTSEPWAVRCAACFKTEAFLTINRPKPGSPEAAGDLTVSPEDAIPPAPRQRPPPVSPDTVHAPASSFEPVAPRAK